MAATPAPEGYYNEVGSWVAEPPPVPDAPVQIVQQHIVLTENFKEDILVEFGAGLNINSIDSSESRYWFKCEYY